MIIPSDLPICQLIFFILDSAVENASLATFEPLSARAGDVGNQCRRDLGTIQLDEFGLDLTGTDAAGVKCDDLVIESTKAPLPLGNNLGVEGAVAIAGHLQRQLALCALQGFAALAVAGVAAVATGRFVGRATQMIGHLAF